MGWKLPEDSTNPCKPECPDRKVGCHGNCQRYAEWKAKRAELSAAVRKDRERYGTLSENAQRKMWRDLRWERQQKRTRNVNSDR